MRSAKTLCSLSNLRAPIASGRLAALRRFALLLACALGAACDQAPVTARPASPTSAKPQHYLGEWFSLGAARCRLLSAEATLTEANDADAGRVPEDLYVVDTAWACEDRGSAPLPITAALSSRARATYADDRGVVHARSLRTVLGRRAPDHLVFELPERDDGLPRPRSYDARTGAPLDRRERRRARLSLEQDASRVVIAPWPRSHQAELDDFVDRLARALASGAPFESAIGDAAIGTADTSSTEPSRRNAAGTSADTEPTNGTAGNSSADAELRNTAELYRAALELGATRLVRRAAERSGEHTQIALALEAERRLGQSVPVTTLRLELARELGRLAIVRLLEPERTRAELSCALTRRALTTRVAQARAERPEQASCNALGVLLPGPCAQVDRALLADALRLGTDCRISADLALGPAALPADFELRLRRSRALEGTGAGYALTLARSGHVRFEGTSPVGLHAVREGRTSEPLLAALAAKLAQLGWFERPAGKVTRGCDEDAGSDVFSVRAGGRERTVRDRHGCRAGFTSLELASLRRAIEHVAAVAAFSDPGSAPDEDEAEVWVVAAE